MGLTLPLNALRAFEAAARLGSFTLAGKELGVSSAAVGQQVRGLEARLGTVLLLRSPEGLTPTPEAKSALPEIRRGLDCLENGFRSLTPDLQPRSLALSAAPTFAMKWLIPRLHRFCERHPTIELSFDTAMRFVDVVRGEADLAIRFGPGRYAGLRSERLLDEWVLPLSSSEVRGRIDSRHPPDPEQFVLLHLHGETADKSWPTWPQWATKQGFDGERFSAGPRFTQSAMAMEAAGEGQGVALCGITYALDLVLAGVLCAPFGTSCAVRTNYGYDLVYAPARADNTTIRAFRRWIKAEAEKSRRAIETFLHPAGLSA